MVYAVCLRITRDPHASEDLSQDCFLELARNAATLRTSVAGWLHSAATNRAINLIRSRKRDRKYELLGEPIASIRETEDFSELQPFVDEALDRLDQQLREIVISHYLRGETQAEIAGHLGIDQSTVSRRLAQGLDDVRSHLRRMGILTTVAALMNVLGQNTASAAPANLTEMVAKVGLAGVGWTATKSAAGSLGLLATAAVAALGNVLLYLVCDRWIFLLLIVVEFALVVYPPGWFKELVTAWSSGHDPWSHPAFPLKRWTWTVPPRDWKQRLAAWSFLGLVWGLAATAVLSKGRGHWGGPAAFVLLASFGVLQAVRLGMRVWRFRRNLPIAAPDTLTFPGTVTTWESVAVAAAALLVGVTLLVAAPRDRGAGIPVIHAVLLWSNIIGSAAIVLWGLRSRLTSSRRAHHLTPQEGPGEASAPPPVKKRAGFAVLAILLVVSLVNVSQSLFAAATAQFVLREPYLRQVPFGIAAGGGIGMILAVVFLFRLRLMRVSLVRWGYLLLLAAGITLLGCGAGLTGYGGYLVQSIPPPAPPAVYWDDAQQ
jgi:RNA polymerase sigma-70 factor (ECF subfamily)